MNMQKQLMAATFIGAGLILASCGQNETGGAETARSTSAKGATEVNGLKTPAAFASIADDEERAAALFVEMSKVMLHPRCANCHPVTGGPTQGDDMHPHEPPVVRGAGIGAAGVHGKGRFGVELVAIRAGRTQVSDVRHDIDRRCVGAICRVEHGDVAGLRRDRRRGAG